MSFTLIILTADNNYINIVVFYVLDQCGLTFIQIYSYKIDIFSKTFLTLSFRNG